MLSMLCLRLWRLEIEVRHVWCVGGPAMHISEVAFYVGHTECSLRSALGHIPRLNYYTIRNAGLEALIATGSTCGRALGFLADGDVFEILQRDTEERKRLALRRSVLTSALSTNLRTGE